MKYSERLLVFHQFMLEMLLDLSDEFEFNGKIDTSSGDGAWVPFDTNAEALSILILNTQSKLLLMSCPSFCLVIDAQYGEIELDFASHRSDAAELAARIEALAQGTLEHLEESGKALQGVA